MGKVKKAFGAFLVPLLSVLLAFLIGGIIMAALGANPFLAVKFLFQGAFGSKAGIGTTLTKATPLIFTALCACFAYKCGVFNLGGEGQFLMGSIAAFLTCYFTGLTGFAGVLLALLAGAVAGGFWGMIPGVLKIGRGQNEMIISIMLNYVATLFMGVIYTSWIRDASVPQTPAIADEVHLPRIITGMRFTWGFVIAVAVGLILYYVLFWTSAGFRLRVLTVTECAYGAVLGAYLRRTGAENDDKDRCIVSIGHRSTHLYIYHGATFDSRREIDVGGRLIDEQIAEHCGVDIHLAHSYMRSDYNGVLEADYAREAYSRLAVEIMKAVNFYNYNNRDRELHDLYICGGGGGIEPMLRTIVETTRLTLHPVSELLSQQLSTEEPWTYLRAIGGVSEGIKGGLA